MKKTYLLLALLMVVSITQAQVRSLPRTSIEKAELSAVSDRSLTLWDYFNDFQDTTMLDDMNVDNLDENDDSQEVTVGLGLHFNVDTWLILHYNNNNNYWAGSNSSFDTLEAADRWLITPAIVVNNYSTLNWRAHSVQLGATVTNEAYSIYISTDGGADHNDFTNPAISSVAAENVEWTDRSIDISAYWGDTIYVAFRHTSLDQGVLALDDIAVGYVHDPADGVLGDFEDAEAFTGDLDPWITLDVDSSSTYVIQGVDFPGAGDPMSFIAFDPLATIPAIAGIDVYEGDKFGACFAAIAPPFGNAPNNDWIISPKATVDPNGKVSFYAKSFSNLWGLERFRVSVSTTDADPASFTMISTGDYVEVDTAWTYFEFDLSAYSNQAVHVGINCVSDTAFIFCIDDIRLDTLGANDIGEINGMDVELFPNPSNGVFHLNRVEGAQVVVYDLLGKEQYRINEATYKNKMDLRHLTKGVYVINIRKGDAMISRKVQIL